MKGPQKKLLAWKKNNHHDYIQKEGMTYIESERNCPYKTPQSSPTNDKLNLKGP